MPEFQACPTMSNSLTDFTSSLILEGKWLPEEFLLQVNVFLLHYSLSLCVYNCKAHIMDVGVRGHLAGVSTLGLAGGDFTGWPPCGLLGLYLHRLPAYSFH